MKGEETAAKIKRGRETRDASVLVDEAPPSARAYATEKGRKRLNSPSRQKSHSRSPPIPRPSALPEPLQHPLTHLLFERLHALSPKPLRSFFLLPILFGIEHPEPPHRPSLDPAQTRALALALRAVLVEFPPDIGVEDGEGSVLGPTGGRGGRQAAPEVGGEGGKGGQGGEDVWRAR